VTASQHGGSGRECGTDGTLDVGMVQASEPAVKNDLVAER
jgi:hypothetical protein